MTETTTGFPLKGTSWTTTSPAGALAFNTDGSTGSFTPSGGSAVSTYWNQSGFNFVVQTQEAGGFPASNSIWVGTYTGPVNASGSGTCTVCSGSGYGCETFAMTSTF